MNMGQCDSAPSQMVKRKVFINGQAIEKIRNIKIEMDDWLTRKIQIEAFADNIEIKDGDFYITLSKDKEKLTKEQLRKLIVDNLDNFEAMKMVEEFKLNKELK